MYYRTQVKANPLQKMPKKQWRAWSEEEARLFAELFQQHQKKFKLYQPHFPERNLCQIKSFYYNGQKKRDGAELGGAIEVRSKREPRPRKQSN